MTQSLNLLAVLPKPKWRFPTFWWCVGVWLFVLAIVGVVAIIGGSMNGYAVHAIAKAKKNIALKQRKIRAEQRKANMAGAAFVAFAQLPSLDDRGYYNYLKGLTTFSMGQANLLQISIENPQQMQFFGLSEDGPSIYSFVKHIHQLQAYAQVNFNKVKVFGESDILPSLRAALPEDLRQLRILERRKKLPKKEIVMPVEMDFYNAYLESQDKSRLSVIDKKDLNKRISAKKNPLKLRMPNLAFILSTKAKIVTAQSDVKNKKVEASEADALRKRFGSAFKARR